MPRTWPGSEVDAVEHRIPVCSDDARPDDARPDWLRREAREAREARKNHGPQRMPWALYVFGHSMPQFSNPSIGSLIAPGPLVALRV